jgi:hypothetical protein
MAFGEAPVVTVSARLWFRPAGVFAYRSPAMGTDGTMPLTPLRATGRVLFDRVIAYEGAGRSCSVWTDGSRRSNRAPLYQQTDRSQSSPRSRRSSDSSWTA